LLFDGCDGAADVELAFELSAEEALLAAVEATLGLGWPELVAPLPSEEYDVATMVGIAPKPPWNDRP
jgi:hypothetical protein